MFRTRVISDTSGFVHGDEGETERDSKERAG